MYLINEDYDVGVVLKLIDYGFETLLELSAVLCTCHNSSHVERHNALVKEHARCLALHNALRKTLHNGRFSHTWLTDEDGVVLLASAQNLRYALNLLLAANYRVKFALGSRLCHVNAKAVEHRCVVRWLCLLFLVCLLCIAGIAVAWQCLVIIVLVGKTKTAGNVATVGVGHL